MEQLVRLLTEKKLTISSCESLTGGLFASELVNISGASKVFVGGFVTYQDKCKEILLDGKQLLDSVGAVSKEMAILMARTVQEKLQSDMAVSFTGNAGPLPSEGKPVGLVHSCIVFHDCIYTFKDLYVGNREEIRTKCVENAITRVIEIVKSNF